MQNFFLVTLILKHINLKNIARLGLAHKAPPYKKCRIRNTALRDWGYMSWQVCFRRILL